MLQIAAFHGESSCKKTNHCRDICHCTWKPARVKPKPLQIFISNSNGPILIYTLQNNCVDLSTSWDISVSSEMCLVKKDQALWGNYRGLLINYARGYSISGFEIYLKEETGKPSHLNSNHSSFIQLGFCFRRQTKSAFELIKLCSKTTYML